LRKVLGFHRNQMLLDAREAALSFDVDRHD
jgi:hypothetical protein